RARELGREALDRRHCPLCQCSQARGSVPFLWGESRCSGGGRLRELRHVAQSFSLRTEALLVVGLHALRVLDQCAQLDKPRLRRLRTCLRFFVSPSRRDVLPPCASGRCAQVLLLVADVRVEDVELVGRARETTLLEVP